MIIITTSSSMSVKPRCSGVRPLPVMVMHPVQPLTLGERVHVVQVIPRLWIIGRTRVTAQSPALLRRRGAVRKERVARHAAQEIEHHLLLAGGVFDPRV